MDPFSSYAFRIPLAEMAGAGGKSTTATDDDGGVSKAVDLLAKEDKGLDHIDDPAMQSLMQREITR